MTKLTKAEEIGVQSWINYMKSEGEMHQEQGSEGTAYDYLETVKTLQMLLDKLTT